MEEKSFLGRCLSCVVIPPSEVAGLKQSLKDADDWCHESRAYRKAFRATFKTALFEERMIWGTAGGVICLLLGIYTFITWLVQAISGHLGFWHGIFLMAGSLALWIIFRLNMQNLEPVLDRACRNGWNAEAARRDRVYAARRAAAAGPQTPPPAATGPRAPRRRSAGGTPAGSPLGGSTSGSPSGSPTSGGTPAGSPPSNPRAPRRRQQ